MMDWCVKLDNNSSFGAMMVDGGRIGCVLFTCLGLVWRGGKRKKFIGAALIRDVCEMDCDSSMKRCD